MVKFSLYSKLLWVISRLYGRGKLLEQLILIVVTLPLRACLRKNRPVILDQKINFPYIPGY